MPASRLPKPKTAPALEGVEDASDPDWGMEPTPEAREGLDVAEVDSAPCPKCGTPVLFGLPTCESCGIILTDFWEEEAVIHPLSAVERR